MPGLTALVPLDGTKFSESAYGLLPFIKGLGFDKVFLVSVWEGGSRPEDVVPGRESELGEAVEKGAKYAEAYLTAQAESARAEGLQVETVARSGRAAESIIEVAKEHSVDLIVIATHGRTGIARWRLGSVADKIVREAPCPALVIGPNVNVELAPYAIKRILVPLDGAGLAEEALPIAKWIARATGCEIDLVRSVSLAPLAYDQSAEVYSGDLLTAMEDSAKVYLDRIAGEVGGRVRTSLLIGSAADQILEYLKQQPAGLVIMASSGRGGLARAALGSVTDKILHGPAPVLVFRAEEETTSQLVKTAKAAV